MTVSQKKLRARRSVWHCLVLGAGVGIVSQISVGHDARGWAEVLLGIAMALGVVCLIRFGIQRVFRENGSQTAVDQARSSPTPSGTVTLHEDGRSAHPREVTLR